MERIEDMFTKENTKQIKGIAILLMLAHHLFAFPERMPYDTSIQTPFYISGMELTELIGGFGKICVSIYMFMGGYGLYKRYASCVGKKVECNRLGSDIIKLYKAYWKVLLVMVPIAFMFFSNQGQYCIDAVICTRYDNWSMKDFFQNFFGFSRTFNSEWWFFWSYLIALFEGYIFIEIFKNKRNLYLEIGAVILWSILQIGVFPILPFEEGYSVLWNNAWYNEICLGTEFVILFFVGIVFSKYSVFEGWNGYLISYKKIEKLLLSAAGIGLTIYVRQFFLKMEYDIVIAPLFIFVCYVFVEESKVLKKFLGFLGENSTNMWLVHTFFCFYFGAVAKFIYGFNNAAISYVVLFFMSLISSICINVMWKIIGKGYQFVGNYLTKRSN